MFKKILIANRGAIACRIIRTLRRLNVSPIAVYTAADLSSLHIRDSDSAYLIGDGPAADSYLNIDKILAVAHASGAQAIHPGYGFLSENAAFAEACAAQGIAFIGPTPAQLRAFGLKHTARELAREVGVPMLPGTPLLATLDDALVAAREIRYPVMLKSTAGGGGIGMRLCRDASALTDSFTTVQTLAQRNFADGGVYLERFIEHARHLEVQIFGDGCGHVVSLGERDCSLQRRHQKVVEEAPAPNLDDRTRAALAQHAVALGQSVGYRSAGTVEYVMDVTSGEFYFLEVNTRLQVEHGVTEMVTGIDLVEWMVRLAADDLTARDLIAPKPHGHALQVRLYAEDPAKNFQPSAGLLTDVTLPSAVRCDTWIQSGCEVSPHYDPMLAKVIVHAASRAAALSAMDDALDATQLCGIETNLDYLRQVVAASVFTTAQHTTRTLGELVYHPETIEVLHAGTETTLQDYPGRLGYWAVGVPPSGPFDSYAFRLGNALLGNPAEAAGLEMTITGVTLKFNRATVVCLTGAAMTATLDGAPLSGWEPAAIPAHSVLKVERLVGDGARAYLTVRGGFDVPLYLGSRATFTLGQFGGHAGRPLRAGDVLRVMRDTEVGALRSLPATLRPAASQIRQLRVMYGPHGSPDFFTERDIETFFAHPWEVHYNSSRTGIRLIGPKPHWARADGGEAGLHPSNLHDNAYAIGAVDFTGDMPVILGPDGPSLGGFVCPATVIAADRWKLGQLRAGDKIQFIPVDIATANILEAAHEQIVETLVESPTDWHASSRRAAVWQRTEAPPHAVGVSYRPAGDQYLLIEYGPLVLDINLRFRVHALMRALEAARYPGIIDLTPGIRSLQIHYDSRRWTLPDLMRELVGLESQLDAHADATVESRIVHLPLSWDDPATQLAVDRYMQSVRKDAPWCPSNLEFIRRINGLASIDAVRDIVFNANYLVMGLGDVYLGAPVATPIDPRHRLVTTKYNPARTWTPENAVGIGGSYLCIYGMEGPGGYQFVGRTLQMWNRHRATRDFTRPWLLRFFDQIRFFPVTADELLEIRAAFPHGRYAIKVEDSTFNLADYNRSLRTNADSIRAFKTRQQAAFTAERERWEAAGQALEVEVVPADLVSPPAERTLATHERAITTQVHGRLWQLNVRAGQQVAAGDTLAVLESMKMEIAVIADEPGVITEVRCSAGTQVAPGQTLLVVGVA